MAGAVAAVVGSGRPGRGGGRRVAFRVGFGGDGVGPADGGQDGEGVVLRIGRRGEVVVLVLVGIVVVGWTDAGNGGGIGKAGEEGLHLLGYE